MPFRTTFACLWCGRSHSVRGPDDIEGWAQVCPDCLGRAGDNEFLRFRLRTALEERGRARDRARRSVRPGPDDDWYLRRGIRSRGAIDDASWAADLDAATLWLDALPSVDELAEPVAGGGWWSPLLAGKGQLWVYDPDPEALELARARLLAHGLRAHLHVRDPWAEPEHPVEMLVTTFWLGRLEPADRGEWLRLARRWLHPGGRHALLELSAGRPGASGLVAAPPERGERGAPAGPAPVGTDGLVRALDEAGLEVERLETGGSIVRLLARALGA